MDDPYENEKRIRAIGRASTGRHIFVVFVIRRIADRLLLRPISARYMHKKEIKCYENYKS